MKFVSRSSHNQRAYILRCWREGGKPGEAAEWRFMLKEIANGDTEQGFATLTGLLTFLQFKFGGSGRSDPPDDACIPN